MTDFIRALPLRSLLAVLLLSALAAPCARSASIGTSTVDLSTTPPDLTTTVDPNLIVTFDDSGSMAYNYMGDNRPFDQGSWSGPWFCAGVIDPRDTDDEDARSKTMNGVYYNPNITYAPADYEDGSAFPDADATLAAVWEDGIAVNRPVNAVTAATAGYHDNPTGSSSSSDSGVTNLLGTETTTTTTGNGHGHGHGHGNGGTTKTTDNRWSCGYGSNPFDEGGPYYYRLKSGVSISNSDGSVNTTALYTAANWEAVQVDSSQYQNFANWYAYYRTRSLMTRTSMSIAFASLGDDIRILWQDMNRSASPGQKISSSSYLQTFEDSDDDTPRSDFFNFIYQVYANGGTPARASTIRAGEVFRRSLSKNKLDPYWNGTSGDDASDLACRKNFHIMVTDGYWNESDPSLPGSTNGSPGLTSANTSQVSQTLPDDTSYSPSSKVSLIYGNVAGNSVYTSSMANIAWYYWATDLEPSLDDDVGAYFADTSTGVTASSTDVDASDPGATPEVYWNPANDPATWQHVQQYFVTLGVAGTLDYPDDLDSLRNGTLQWPYPVNNAAQAVDDTWHAAVNSRGGFISASDPDTLVTSLNDIIASIIASSTSSTSPSLTTSTLTSSTLAYVSGYNSSDWSGSLKAESVDSSGALGSVQWDAGCLLTGGYCTATATNVGDATDPDTRVILSSSAVGAGNGIAFRWEDLSGDEQALLDVDPSSGDTDSYGENRLDYIRGVRTDETSSLDFRSRSSVLGAIIDSQAVYEGAPSSDYSDDFPSGSPEAQAAALSVPSACTASSNDGDGSLTACNQYSYEVFAYNNRARPDNVYVGSNDGMLHAFNASSGAERFAYVPATVYSRLNELPYSHYTLTPTVDATPVLDDVFFDSAWHTILVGGLRYGGRGIYALDVTTGSASEDKPTDTVLWEFNSTTASSSAGDPADLGYTYGEPNIARLAYNGGTWVVLVPGGYFPADSSNADSSVAAASATRSSLFVLDAATGKLIKELKTPSGVTSYGMARPVVGDYDDDQVDDVAFAGDVLGNLWRIDLSSTDPGSWSVERIFKPTTAGAQPITSMPRLFPDTTGKFMVVFGTGKYLSLSDRTTTDSVTQAVYGIRDYGAGSSNYPSTLDSLLQQTLSESSDGVRGLTENTITSSDQGWYFNLDVDDGERVVVSPTALFSTNRAIITTLIPGSSDPCDPSREGAVMVIDALSGGASGGVSVDGTSTLADGTSVVGAKVKSSPSTGSVATTSAQGGGTLLLPGIITTDSSSSTFSVDDPFWHRRSWRRLLQTQ